MMRKRNSRSALFMYTLCVFGVLLGYATVNAGEGGMPLDQLYNEVTEARDQANVDNLREYDPILFANAEASYEEGSILYEGKDARAMQTLQTALEQYNDLIALADSGSLRELAEQEYQRAVAVLDETTLNIVGLSDELLKAGVVPAAGELDLDGVREDKDAEMMDKDAEMMDKDGEMMDKECDEEDEECKMMKKEMKDKEGDETQ